MHTFFKYPCIFIAAFLHLWARHFVFMIHTIWKPYWNIYLSHYSNRSQSAVLILVLQGADLQWAFLTTVPTSCHACCLALNATMGFLEFAKAIYVAQWGSSEFCSELYPLASLGRAKAQMLRPSTSMDSKQTTSPLKLVLATIDLLVWVYGHEHLGIHGYEKTIKQTRTSC